MLVVEDDSDLASAIGSAVEDLGFRAVCVPNGRLALSTLEDEQPSLMLVDLFMAVMNGIDLLREVRKSPKLSRIPVVIMTGANDSMIGVKADATVLYKPVDLDALAQIVHRYCEQI